MKTDHTGLTKYRVTFVAGWSLRERTMTVWAHNSIDAFNIVEAKHDRAVALRWVLA